MKPVRREELLKSESAKDTVIKPKKKSSSKEVRKPKKQSVHRPGQDKKIQHKTFNHINKREKSLRPTPKKHHRKLIGGALVAAAGVGAVVVVSQENKQSDSSTATNNSSSTNSGLDFKTAESNKTTKHRHGHGNRSHSDKKLNELLDDSSSHSHSSKGRSSSSLNEALNDSLKIGGASGRTLKSLIREAQKSTEFAAALGTNNIDSSHGNDDLANKLMAANATPTAKDTLDLTASKLTIPEKANNDATQVVAANKPTNATTPSANLSQNSTENSETPAQPAPSVPKTNNGTTAGINTRPGTVTGGQSGTNTNTTPAEPAQPSTVPSRPTQPSTSTTPIGPTQPTSTNPGTPVQPGSSTTPGSSVTPGSSANPGSSTTPGSSANPGSSTTPGSSAEPGSSANPGSSTTPGSSAEPGSSTTPGSSTEPGGNVTAKDLSVSAKASTGINDSGSTNVVPVAEDVAISYNKQAPQSVSGLGTGFKNDGQYTINAQVKLDNGKVATINKIVTVGKGAALNDGDADNTVKNRVVAASVTVTPGQTVLLFDSYNVTSNNGGKVEGTNNGGGITLSQPGNYQLTYRIGDLSITKNITVVAKA